MGHYCDSDELLHLRRSVNIAPRRAPVRPPRERLALRDSRHLNAPRAVRRRRPEAAAERRSGHRDGRPAGADWR